MELSEDNKNKLEQFKLLFKGDKLTREQIDYILARKISNVEWNELNNKIKPKKPKTVNWKKVFKPIAKKAAVKAIQKQLDTNIEIQNKRCQRANKVLDQKDKYHFVTSLSKPYKDDYKIVKTYEHYVSKYNSTLSH
jgi:hypothetical protein